MKTFEQSLKSQKTVKCMIETRGEKPKEKVKPKKNKGSKKEGEATGRMDGGNKYSGARRLLAAPSSCRGSFRQEPKPSQHLVKHRRATSSPPPPGRRRS